MIWFLRATFCSSGNWQEKGYYCYPHKSAAHLAEKVIKLAAEKSPEHDGGELPALLWYLGVVADRPQQHRDLGKEVRRVLET